MLLLDSKHKIQLLQDLKQQIQLLKYQIYLKTT